MGKFLSVDQIKFAAFTLNRIAYQVYKTPETASLFGKHFLEDLKDVLSRLHNRDERNKLFPADFWIIDRSLAKMQEGVSFKKLISLVSHSLLENCP